MGVDRLDIIPIDQWRQGQSAMGQAVFGDVLAAERLYEIDGGVFQARRTDTGRWELWAWMGKAGHEVTRSGFEIDAQGLLYERLYDLEAGEALVLQPARFTVEMLRPVSKALLASKLDELARLQRKAVY